MKNLLKVLLVLAFSTTAFGDMGSNMKWPDPASVTTDAIMKMSTADVNGWLANLTADQYGKLSSDVQNWMNTGLTMDQYNMLKPEVQALVTKPASM
ncbi:DUF2673 domain-containing protein [Rickettsia endosymbiont of Gonocerus acuteangulatus]|uniref:DUF2673 domain-containing protein n=1 Tax=Rickettsia endosymbiont of Gonocerus acuteangulatus TaxID=3066266 RepID=UPI003132A96A